MIELKNNDYSCIINPDRGANCISFKNEKAGLNILREPDYKNLDNPYVYGMPILFPVNRISNGEFVFEGRKYKYPINDIETNCFSHGTLHETEFEILYTDNTHAELLYKATKKSPYLTFPHEFDIKISYILNTGSMTQKTEIINNSEDNLPVFLGYHTTFNIPFVSGSKSEDVLLFADLECEYERDEHYLPTGKLLPKDDITEQITNNTFMPASHVLSRHYKAGNSGVMQLTDTKNDVRITYKSDKNLNYRLLYNGGSQNFICLEMQNCIVNYANSPFRKNDDGFDFVKPHNSNIYCSKIEVTM